MTTPDPTIDRRLTAQRLKRLTIKEMREILRDRRTIITLILMPLLVYPMLSLVFNRFLLTAMPNAANVELVVAVNPPYQPILKQILDRGGDLLPDPLPDSGESTSPDGTSPDGTPPAEREPQPTLRIIAADDVANAVRELKVDVGVVIAPRTRAADGRESVDPRFQGMTLEVLYRADSALSRTTQRYVEDRLTAYNEAYYQGLVERLAGRQRQAPKPPAEFRRRAIEIAKGQGMSLATVAPLILILMTITGAVYPAIDLTAGERERGTLETLIAAPVPRMGLLFAKYTAVLSVALMTATINLVAMTTTVLVSGLGEQIFGSGGLSPLLFFEVFALLALFAAFFSAVLLTLTSMAKSFKEAQAYLVPLMLISLAPGILGVMPGLELNAILAITPLVNIVLVTRDLLNGQVDLALAAVAISATLLYTAAAIAFAANVFGGDAVLYGAQGSWRDTFRRPSSDSPDPTNELNERARVAQLSTATLCLAIIFPLFYLIVGLLSRLPGNDMSAKILLAGLATPLLFGVIPFALAWWNRVSFKSGFALGRPQLLALLPAFAFGVAMWPLAHEIVLIAEAVGIGTIDAKQFEGIESMLEAWRLLPIWAILLALAAGPAVFEELFFRGMLFGALQRSFSAWKTIAISAVLFGVFHVVAGNVLAVERLLPSAFIGLFLGWLRYRSGSVWPSILAHLIHNGLLLSVAYYRDELKASGWDMATESHLPLHWLAAAGTTCAVGLVLAWPLRSKRIPQDPKEAQVPEDNGVAS